MSPVLSFFAGFLSGVWFCIIFGAIVFREEGVK